MSSRTYPSLWQDISFGAGSCRGDGAMERTTATSEALLETLISRGWRFRDADEIRGLIRSTASDGGRDEAGLMAAVESELLNMDLRSFGGKCLPDTLATKKLSQLHGPLILQVVSVRDIYQSSIDASFKDSQCHHRLLRFGLTDGHAEAIAIEYSPIPSISEGIIPGTKVLLGNKIAVHNGILCLNPKVVTILGGLAQSLYDEWQMSRKYSGISRSTFKLSQNTEGVGPPPFERLQLEAGCSQPYNSQDSWPIARNSLLKSKGAKNHDVLIEVKEQFGYVKADGDHEMASSTTTEGKQSSSDSRPKEVIEAVPVQNQAAAQKLLQKMSQPTHDNRHHKGPKYRGKGKQEETAVFTLDEWERKKANLIPVGTSEIHDVSRDEELARQLQNQLDLEDTYVGGNSGMYDTEADQIKISMFNYGRMGEMNDGRRESLRRGGGRGRWRGRGRGRGRFD